MDKKLSNANNLTLLELNTTDLKGNVTWMRELQQAEHLAVKLDAGYIVRKGMENIYGEAGGSSYGALISTSLGMKVTNSRIAVSGLWEKLLTDKGVWGGSNCSKHNLPSVGNGLQRRIPVCSLVCFGEFFACPFAVSEEAATIDRRS